MTATLSRVLDHRSGEIAGRERERAVLGELLEAEAPLAVWLHGIAGIGKSALLRAFAVDARALGATTIELDGRTVEPTEAGFLLALSAALDTSVPSVSDVADALAASGARVVLALDHVEALGLLDAWLRRTLLPALPDGARLAIATRHPPVAAWRCELGPLLRTIALRGLEPTAAEALLRRDGVPAAQAPLINRIAHGHPLSLKLAASVLAERPGTDLHEAAAPAVADAFAGLYLDGLDPPTRRALDAASVTRRVTLPLLAAMLPDVPAHEAFARLRALPFTELGPHGLVVQETVREAVAGLLRAADPGAYRRLRAAAWRQLRTELRDARPDELWRYTADMLFLLDHPLIRAAFFPTSAPSHAIEPAGSGDWPRIEAIARRHQPSAAVELLRGWWDGAPHVFTVARDAEGTVNGFHTTFLPGDVSPRLIDADPVTRCFREHLRRHALPPGQVALFFRHHATLVGGAVPAAGDPATCLDVKRAYLELRPALRRVYAVSTDLARSMPILEPLGFAELPVAPVAIGGVRHHLLLVDLGPGSVDAWFTRLGGEAVHAQDEPRLDVDDRRLVLDGRAVDLTRLELGVLRHLREREGRVVPRAALFQEVWGHEWMGDGNALEVVVSALRRKLGPRAKQLETVRGVGYRLRPLA